MTSNEKSGRDKYNEAVLQTYPDIDKNLLEVPPILLMEVSLRCFMKIQDMRLAMWTRFLLTKMRREGVIPWDAELSALQKECYEKGWC